MNRNLLAALNLHHVRDLGTLLATWIPSGPAPSHGSAVNR
jgi:hypothetical protein